jgi:hypothetical protein
VSSCRNPLPRQENWAARPGSQHDECGFTLVEVLASMLVLTIGVIGIAALLALTTQMHVGARESARSTRLAQDKFDELMKLDLDTDPEVAIGGDLDSDEDDHWDSPTTGITLRWTVEDGPTDDTRLVTVRVLNERARQYRQTDLSTIIRQW